jgi:hypothetical protein
MMSVTTIPDRTTMEWKVVSVAAGSLAGFLAQRAVAGIWTLVAHDEAPTDPADRSRSLPVVASFAIAAGVGAAVARVVAGRSTARVWELATDEPPPL